MLLEAISLVTNNEAARLLNEAIDLYREMGMPKHLAMAEDPLKAKAGLGSTDE